MNNNNGNKVRNSTEIPRTELIFMIAKLRGILYSVKDGKKNLDWTKTEIESVLEKTTFNVSGEDDISWNEFSKKYL